MDAGPEKRSLEAARRLAEELEATGIALSGDLAVEMLVKAADIRSRELSDPASAMVLLRRVLKDAPRSRLAIGQALQLAERMGADEDLAELLALAVRVTKDRVSTARLIARRADLLATKLGRIAEARGLYRDAARLVPHTALGSAADAAADRIDVRLAEERAGQKGAPLDVVDDGPLRFDEITVSHDDPDDALESLRNEIGARAPLDQTLVLKGVRIGIEKGRLNVIARLLPWMSADRRAALLEEIAVGAEVTDDADAARHARAAAFLDAPSVDPYFDAVIGLVDDAENVARVLERRAAVAGSQGLLDHTERIDDEKRRAKVLVQLVRQAPDIDTLESALAVSEALAKKMDSMRQLARVLSAAASHSWLPGPKRGAILLRLATVLETELDDAEGARVVEREAHAMMARSGDTQPDTPSPLYSGATKAPDTDRKTIALADEVESIAKRVLSVEADADPLELARAGHFGAAVDALGRVEGPRRAALAVRLSERLRVTNDLEGAARALNAGLVTEGDRTALMTEAAKIAAGGGPWIGSLLDDGAPNGDPDLARAIGFAAARAGLKKLAETQLSIAADDDPDDDDVKRTLLTVRGDDEGATSLADAPSGSSAAARAAFEVAVDARDDVRIDEALRRLRSSYLENNDIPAAFVAAAALVARSADETDDRLTYQAHRNGLRMAPKATLPEDWLADLSEALGPPPSLSAPPTTRTPLSPSDAARASIDAARAAFAMPGAIVSASPDGRVHAHPGPPFAVAVPPSVVAYPRRLRFALARGMAAALDPRLRPGLDYAHDADDVPPPAVRALDRAGLVLAADLAVALAEVGPRTARGLALTRYAVLGPFLSICSAMGLGL